ncbi:Cof-type HAD-IIB family hydrolase [Candidatus Bipolaricaulota bacterium]
MSEPKLLVFDLDGTLLGPDHRIPRDILSLLLSLRDAGVGTTLATGRPFAAVTRFIEELDLGLPLIVFNGAAVVMPDGEPLSVRPLPLDRARSALGLLQSAGVATHLYVEAADTHFLTDRLGSEADYIREKDGMACDLVEDLAGFLDDLEADPVKLFSIGPREVLLGVQSAFRSLAPEATCVFSEHDMLEFLGPGVNKGTALAALCSELGIGADSVVAFGDNLNDLEMLRAAGRGVSMAGAPDDMRLEADDTTDDLAGYLGKHFGHLVGKELAA